jgi:glycosyltransferase involved in cell wall biosynthesis
VAAKVAPNADAQVLAAAIRDLIADPDARRALGSNALDYVRTHNFDHAARRLLDAIGLQTEMRRG